MPTHQRSMALRAVCLLVLVLPALATCPVTLPSSAFAGVVTPCASPPSLTALCTQCLPAVAGPFVVAGVSASDAVTLGVCIQSTAVAILMAGVNASSLSSLASCSTPSPPPPAASPPPSPTTPSCPVSQTQNFAAAVTPCSNPSNACTACATALATPFVLNGVSPSDTTTLGVCINAQISAIMGAGVSPTTLAALAGCGSSPSAPPPPPPAIPVTSPPPPATTCPVSQPQNFSAAVGPCSSIANACTSCLTALAVPFILAGVSPSSSSIIAACIMAQASVMTGAGVSGASLAALSGCGAPVPSLIASPPPVALPPPAVSPPPPSTTPSCPVSQTQSFASAVAPCANSSAACTTCVTALAMPFILSGVSPSDVTTLAVCISAQMSVIIAAGVSPTTLSALTSCGAAQPPPPLASPPPLAAPNPPASAPTASPPPQATPAICPITTTLSYAAAVTPCSVLSNLCTSCLTALATPIVLAGVPPSSTAVIAACITSQFTAMVAAGVSPTTIMGLSSCSSAPPSAAPPPPLAAAVTTPSPPPAQPGSASAASPPPSPGFPVVPTLACTVAQPIDFTAAVQPCSNASNACSTCLQALAASVIRAGVRYNNTAAWISCFQTHSLEMLAVGVPLSTLTAMNWCTARSYQLAAPPAPSSMPPSRPPAWSQQNMFDLSSGAQGVGPWRVVAAAAVAILLA